MATVKTIKPAGGGDYTSLALWEDAVDGEASAAQWAECYSGGNLGAVTLSGWSATPDASNYPKIYAAEGNSHGADVSSGAYISSSAPMSIGIPYTRIDSIRVSCTANSATAVTFLPSGTSRDCKVENCIIHGTFSYGIVIGQSSSGVTSSNYVTNNIIIIDGTANTTPAGVYAYGTDGSSGTTNSYIYNNSIYVDNQTSLVNYGIRFANSSSCTLNITVENNIVIGGLTVSGTSVTYCYDQLTFSTGTKTFNNNISSDSTADDFGGTNHHLKEIASNIWEDVDSNNFHLFKKSVAVDKGKTIAYVSSDILYHSRPQGDAYDIGAIERKVKVEIIYGQTPDFSIPDSLLSKHEHITDALIDGRTGHTCQLIYPVTKNSVCPNCVYSPRERKSSNIYKTGGPVPFTDHTTCPWCGGEGRSTREIKEDIKLRIYWSQKDWVVSGPVESPESSVMVIGYITNLPKLEKADRILLNKNIGPYRKWICERSGESIPWGISQDRYFAQMLKRVGGG